MAKDKGEKLSSNELMKGMSDLQLSRWIALFDGINIIDENMELEGKKWDTTNIKHPALEEYVDNISVLILRELTGKEVR